MLDVLYFSDRHVQARLFECVERTPGLLLVTAVRHPAGSAPVEQREPFRSLEARLGELVTFVVVADEGSPEGMWRDPVGNLADRLFPDRREAAYEAAQGYLLLQDGHPLEVVRKRGDGGREDAWFIQEVLAAQDGRIPRPDPARRPRAAGPERVGAGKPGAGRPGVPGRGAGAPRRPQPTARTRQEPAASRAITVPEQPAVDVFALLGITPETTRGEAKKAFRAKVALYHPDKVAHLADEFRSLAEARTRALMEAWEAVQDQLAD